MLRSSQRAGTNWLVDHYKSTLCIFPTHVTPTVPHFDCFTLSVNGLASFAPQNCDTVSTKHTLKLLWGTKRLALSGVQVWLVAQPSSNHSHGFPTKILEALVPKNSPEVGKPGIPVVTSLRVISIRHLAKKNRPSAPDYASEFLDRVFDFV